MGWVKVHDNVDRDALYHYGVEGMHWGQRRYQNYDGTLTSAGKKRYLSGKKSRLSDKTLQAHNQHMQAARDAHNQQMQAHNQHMRAAQDAHNQQMQAHMRAAQDAQDAHMQAVQNHQMMSTMPMMFGKKDEKKTKGLFKKKEDKPDKFKSKSLNRDDFSEDEIRKAIMSGDPDEIQKVATVLSLDEYKYAINRIEMNKKVKEYKEIKDDDAWKKTEKNVKRAKQAVDATVYTYDTIRKFDEAFGLGLDLPSAKKPGKG